MEENQSTSSKSNKRKKKKSAGSGEKSEEQNHIESQSEKQLPSQQQLPKPQKQPHPQQEQPKQKQLKSPKSSQPEKRPSPEEFPLPKAKKHPKPPKESQSQHVTPPAPVKKSLEKKHQTSTQPETCTQPQTVTQPAPAKKSLEKKHQPSTQPETCTQPQTLTQPAPAKQSLKKKHQTSTQPETCTQPQTVTQPAPAKKSLEKKHQTSTQPETCTQPQTVTQPAPAKKSLEKKHQPSTQPETCTQPQTLTQPAPAKQSLKKKHQPGTQSKTVTELQIVTQSVTQPAPAKQSLKTQPSAEKQSSPDKELPNRQVPEPKFQSSEPFTAKESVNLELKLNDSAAEVETSRNRELESSKETRTIDSKCVPSGDSPFCKVTTCATSAKGSDVTDATCARNASASIASATPTAQVTKMTGATDVKAEGRPAISKSREEIEAERKLRKAAKQAKKGKKPDEESKNAQQVVEGVKQLKVEDKVEVPKENVEKSSYPKIKVTKASEGETTEKQPAEGGKSKAELRAERRTIQEAQRAAKAASKGAKIQQEKEQQQQPRKPAVDKPPASASDRITSKPKTSPLPKSTERSVKLFSHLYQCSFKSISQSLKVNHPQYHPAIVRLGVQYSERVVLGSNARCVALLHALKQVIADYETPPQKEFARGLEAYLQPNVEFLQRCRPLAVSMTNALRHLKRQLTALPNSIKDSQARQKLLDFVDTYIKDQIETAAEAIGITAEEKIADGDVILVYACSSLVLRALKMTHSKGKKFSVVVVDSLPWLEGREMLRRLVSVGIKCTYVHISAASFIMREVTKVLLGAHALLSNGYVMSRAGSSQIALLAHSYNVPVLVCCETHKFSERVQTDSFVYNELANPDELVGKRRNGEDSENRTLPLESWRDLPYLTLLNLVYDVTPPDLVTAVVTELAILPCTSVPVILRIRPTDC